MNLEKKSSIGACHAKHIVVFVIKKKDVYHSLKVSIQLSEPTHTSIII